MMTYKKTIFTLSILIFLIFATSNTYAVRDMRGLHFGLKMPYSYNFGYYTQLSNRISIYTDAQVVAIPFSTVFPGYMNLFGADEKYSKLMNEAFRFGFGFEGGAHYYFGTDNRRYYAGMSAQWINMLTQDIRDKVINDAFDDALNDPKLYYGPIPEEESTTPLTIKSAYLQLGIMAGKKFFYMNPVFEMHVEAGLSKTIASTHRVYSDYRYLSNVSDETNKTLKSIMKRYGWLPTINVYFIYKLK